MKFAKGYWGARRRQYKVMKESVHRGWQYAYIHRRLQASVTSAASGSCASTLPAVHAA